MISRNPKLEKRIQDLLSQMTLEEKVGQLHQMGPTSSAALAGYEFNLDELLTEFLEGRISEAAFMEKVGSQEESLNEDDVRAGRLGLFISLHEPKKIETVQKIAQNESRMGIPVLAGCDIIRGYRTIFPTPLAQSCSWNMDAIENAAAITAKEAYAAGIHWVFGPMLDVARDARWGRIVESAGEDPYLTGEMAKACVYGYQGRESNADGTLKRDKIAACMKHFAAYGAVSGGQDYNTVDMSLPMFYNNYLPPFRAAVDAGVLSTMTAFHDFNGVPCTIDPWLIEDVLRKELGFEGMIVSDAEAVVQCVAHGSAVDEKDATLKAINAGNDVDMASRLNDKYLAELVREGKVSEERLNEAVANVLRLKLQSGVFDITPTYDEKTGESIYLCDEHRKAAYHLAAESAVLLENPNHLLPFSKDVKKIAVIGALADDAENFHGPWAFTGGRFEETVTILEGIRKAVSSDTQVFYEYGCCVQPGAKPDDEDFAFIDAACKLASQCDQVILVAGENLFMSGEAASKTDLNLTGHQETLIRRVCAEGKPTAVVLANGRPLTVGFLKELGCAVLELWYPGTEGGNVAADILFGKINPSGHLTVTFANTAGQEPMYYNHPNTGKPGGKFKFTSKYQDAPVEPLYPFGYGLSYTDFEYSNLKVSVGGNDVFDSPISATDTLDITVTVTNTGRFDGADVIQLYTRDLVASCVRPVKELKGFQKVWIPAGESRQCHLSLPVQSLGFYNRDLNYVVEPGEFKLWVGKDSTQGLETVITVVK